jgi:sulfite exporter TauE/SafE/copper chaperone CopZ
MAEGQQKRLGLELKISGMSCAHCERTVEAAALALEGVETALADAGKGTLALRLGTNQHGQEAEPGLILARLAEALEAGGYAIINSAAEAGARRDGMMALAIGLFIAGGFALADALGVFAIIPTIDAGIGMGALFVTGLLTSLHCVSMCGGIALSQGVKGVLPDSSGSGSALPGTSGFGSALVPSLAYNLGRITSYTIIGALAGAAGAALNIGFLGKAVLMGAAGLFMIGMGLSLAGWMRLPRISWPAYDRFRTLAGIRAARLGPYAVGLANGFMPCGPLQAMQVYALGSGSAGAGALAMFAFSSGTAPLLFAFGAGGALVPIRYRAMAIKAGAVLVAFLGITTLGRAWALSGMLAPWDGPQVRSAVLAPGSVPASTQKSATPSGTVATLVDGIQYVSINVGSRSYGEIVVQAGIPVRFNLKVGPGLLNGCNNAISIPALGIQQSLTFGDNIIEFTPGSVGIIPYSCWMGMIRSRIIVVEASADRSLVPGTIHTAGFGGTSGQTPVGPSAGPAFTVGTGSLEGFFQAVQAVDACCP